MRIEFDPEKDRINRVKHDISLICADLIDLDTALIRPDERFSYGEKRYQAWGFIDHRLHVLVFTMRGDALRAISLRKANARERAFHGES